MKRIETWKDIKGFAGLYQISSLGSIRSYPKMKKLHHGGKYIVPGKSLKPFIRGGYEITVLTNKEKKRKTLTISRLVGAAFSHNPSNLPEINHKNGIKTDNEYTNLEWISKSGNIQHAYKVLKRKPTNSGGGQLRIPVMMKTLSNVTIARFDSISQAEEATKISRHHIGKCISRKRKSAGGYLWVAR